MGIKSLKFGLQFLYKIGFLILISSFQSCSVIGIGTGALIGINTDEYYQEIPKNTVISERIDSHCIITKNNNEKIFGYCNYSLNKPEYITIKNGNGIISKDSVIYLNEIENIEKRIFKKSRIGGALIGGLIGAAIDSYIVYKVIEELTNPSCMDSVNGC